MKKILRHCQACYLAVWSGTRLHFSHCSVLPIGCERLVGYSTLIPRGDLKTGNSGNTLKLPLPDHRNQRCPSQIAIRFLHCPKQGQRFRAALIFKRKFMGWRRRIGNRSDTEILVTHLEDIPAPLLCLMLPFDLHAISAIVAQEPCTWRRGGMPTKGAARIGRSDELSVRIVCPATRAAAWRQTNHLRSWQ